jgi:hypothetical protein
MLKEEMLELAAAATDPEAKRAVLRECLQTSVLRSFHEAEAFLSVALAGEGATGLEFVLLDKKDYKPERWLFAAKRRLWFMGLDPRIAFARKLSVHQGWVKVPGLLAEAGLPEDPAEPLGFRLQISLEKPENLSTTVDVVERFGLRFGVKRTG